MRRYFISYSYINGFENIMVEYPHKISTMEHIEEIQEYIKTYLRNKFDYGNKVKVLYFKEVFDEWV